MTQPKLISTFRERYQEYQDTRRSCPIEDGSFGNLADNECPHGALASDKHLTCDCWKKREVGKR